MTLQIKLGMLVRHRDRSDDIRYKVIYRAKLIIDERTINDLKIAPRQSPLAYQLGQITWICYVSQRSNAAYFCPETEFRDGRFEEVPPAEA
jgi:hypothetical protein